MSEFFSKQENLSKRYKNFRAYKLESVRSALRGMFSGKCAYCERIIIGNAPPEHEHFRPKGAVETPSGEMKPGYYWLASTWSNLLYSCIDCNRVRTHIDGRKSGKGTQFPLVNESLRASSPGGEEGETPLLLDPCVDSPRDHLQFLEDGSIIPRTIAGTPSDRGGATIAVIGLDRVDLQQLRRECGLRVRAQIDRYLRLRRFVTRYPDDDEIVESLAREAHELVRLARHDAEFSELAYQLITEYVPELIGTS